MSRKKKSSGWLWEELKTWKNYKIVLILNIYYFEGFARKKFEDEN